MTEFVLHTDWQLDAPVETVWAVLHDVKRWPLWWRFVRRVEEISPGNADGVGAVRRLTWSSRLPYSLTFDTRVTEIEHPYRMAGIVSGDLEGTGIWTMTRSGATASRAHYEWRVRPAKPWMGRLAPLLRPVFAWNHDQVMRAGERGLAGYLARYDPATRSPVSA